MADNNSKIESVEIFNFMPYEHAIAYFDEHGIINLKGYNSVGKSAFNTAVAVCLMDMYKGKQSKFIRHDCKYFRIIVSFSDGISILRDKYDNGQSLYEMYEDKKCIFSTKQGSKLTRISDVPSPIKTYLDLIETEGSYLNFQDRKSPLWLVETSGSENYRDLHTVLKVEEISRANALLNSDINALNSDITSLESDLQKKELQLQAIQGLDKSFILALTKKENQVKDISNKDDLIHSIDSKNNELSEIRIAPKVDKIKDAKRLRDVEQMGKTLSEYDAIKVIPKVTVISEADRVKAIEKISQDLSEIQECKVQYSEVARVEGIDRQNSLLSIHKTLNSIKPIIKELADMQKEQEELESKKKTIMENAKKDGVILVECENCGTLMEVNTGGL